MKSFRSESQLRDINVLFVCMGNICRSPTAQGVFKQHLYDASLHEVVGVDSAGTHASFAGEPPDRRAIVAAQKRGYSMSRITARRVEASDFLNFDYVLAMDKDNQRNLFEICEKVHKKKVRLLLDFARRSRIKEVPDPYYGSDNGFEKVLDLIEEGSRGFLEFIKTKHSLRP